MILGMTISTFTMVHVLISLVGIFAGLVAMFGLLSSKSLPGWTALFLAMTILTSVTGFFFPSVSITPAQIVGIISLVLLGVAVFALYIRRASGIWRPVYVVTAMTSLYLNVFVLIIQSFQKIRPLHALAPTQSEPPFLVAQCLTLVFFVVVIIGAIRRYRPMPRFAT